MPELIAHMWGGSSRGVENLTVDTLDRLAKALEGPAAELLTVPKSTEKPPGYAQEGTEEALTLLLTSRLAKAWQIRSAIEPNIIML